MKPKSKPRRPKPQAPPRTQGRIVWLGGWHGGSCYAYALKSEATANEGFNGHYICYAQLRRFTGLRKLKPGEVVKVRFSAEVLG